jgi:hypothetical protein
MESVALFTLSAVLAIIAACVAAFFCIAFRNTWAEDESSAYPDWSPAKQACTTVLMYSNQVSRSLRI